MACLSSDWHKHKCSFLLLKFTNNYFILYSYTSIEHWILNIVFSFFKDFLSFVTNAKLLSIFLMLNIYLYLWSWESSLWYLHAVDNWFILYFLLSPGWIYPWIYAAPWYLTYERQTYRKCKINTGNNSERKTGLSASVKCHSAVLSHHSVLLSVTRARLLQEYV